MNDRGLKGLFGRTFVDEKSRIRLYIEDVLGVTFKEIWYYTLQYHNKTVLVNIDNREFEIPIWVITLEYDFFISRVACLRKELLKRCEK